MKKTLYTVSAIALILGSSLYFSTSTSIKAATETDALEKEVYIRDASYATFPDIKALENAADVIAEVKFSGKRETKVWEFEEGDTYTNSITNVEVKKVHKGEVSKGDEIEVYEPAYINENGFYSIEGYNLMDKKGKYLLYLRTKKDGNYSVLGLYQGKYDLNETSTLKELKKFRSYEDVQDREYLGDEVEHFNQLKKENLKKYTQ
ncbi:hypothetical protein P9578_03825 [Brevibacillus choshinensis]|uniref:hypothetical protein n=1 Tax=Brevibacillus choshinensis TaxID=54911 RepID=UPI002E21ED0D|nr:hypothetical protein [Brevibacillus choshinensis]